MRSGAPARIRLGRRWVNDPVELFDDLVRWFPPLFPTLEAEDPDAALGADPTGKESRGYYDATFHLSRLPQDLTPTYDCLLTPDLPAGEAI